MESKSFAWKHNEPIVAHYLQQFERVSALFEYAPQGHLEQRVAWLDHTEHLRAQRVELVDALSTYNKQIENHPIAMRNIEALGESDSLVVVGGQQAGLLTGPQLVIYKAVTIIQAAKRESRRLGRPVVPVFWIAGEDHDYDEVNHAYFLKPNNDIHCIKLDQSSKDQQPKRPSISQLHIDKAQWERVIAELDDVLIHTEFKEQLMIMLQDVMEQSHTLSQCFARLMAQLFGKYGLVLLDSADERLREIEVPMFKKMIEESATLNEALLQSHAQLTSLGYEASAEVRAGQANLFVDVDGQRTLLFETDHGYIDRSGRYHVTRAQLLELAEAEPAKLSNNVFTRPLMQEYVLPVLQTVLGPGEIAYWALLRKAFQTMEMNMPIIVPRLEFTIVERSIQKHMSTYGLSFEDVVYAFDDKKEAWLKEQDKLGLDEQFEEVKEAFQQLYHPLLSQLAHINKGIEKLGETNKLKILEQISFLQTRSFDALAKQHEAGLRQLERIERSIIPLGKKQERVYNIFVYLNKYGVQLIDELVHLQVDHATLHTIIYK